MNYIVTLGIMKKLEEWSSKLEQWITDNYSNPLLWVGILILGVLLLKIILSSVNKGE